MKRNDNSNFIIGAWLIAMIIAMLGDNTILGAILMVIAFIAIARAG